MIYPLSTLSPANWVGQYRCMSMDPICVLITSVTVHTPRKVPLSLAFSVRVRDDSFMLIVVNAGTLRVFVARSSDRQITRFLPLASLHQFPDLPLHQVAFQRA